MTLALGRRVIVIVDGVERWREKDVEEHLLARSARSHPTPRSPCSPARRPAPRRPRRCTRRQAGRRAGGRAGRRSSPGSSQLDARAGRAPGPVARRGAPPKRSSPRSGERQQRLLRELEKLALEGDAERGAWSAGAREASRSIEQRARRSRQREALPIALADALRRLADAPRRRRPPISLLCAQQGERSPASIYLMARALRDASPSPSGSPRASRPHDQARPAHAARARPSASSPTSSAATRARLRGALAVLADLELDSRGGAALRRPHALARWTRTRWRSTRSRRSRAEALAPARETATLGRCAEEVEPASSRAARDFLRAPVLR